MLLAAFFYSYPILDLCPSLDHISSLHFLNCSMFSLALTVSYIIKGQ